MLLRRRLSCIIPTTRSGFTPWLNKRCYKVVYSSCGAAIYILS